MASFQEERFIPPTGEGIAELTIVLLPIGKTIRYSFFALIWLSTFLAYCFHSSALLFLGGGYGYHLSQVFNSVVGFIGTGAILLFSFTGFLVIAFNIPFKRKPSETEDILEEIVPQPLRASMNGPVVTERTDETPRMVNFKLEEEKIEEEELEDLAEEEPINLVELEKAEEELEEDSEAIPMEIDIAIEEEPDLLETDELPHAQGDYDPTLDLSGYQYPTLDLLDSYGDKKIEVNKEELEANKNRIVRNIKSLQHRHR